ncbi:MAG TPA: hypothetical protein VGW38_23820 [Chloroflexota bacterium]|nr:hypothetical protein [Chloroflexota bacterium]
MLDAEESTDPALQPAASPALPLDNRAGAPAVDPFSMLDDEEISGDEQPEPKRREGATE